MINVTHWEGHTVTSKDFADARNELRGMGLIDTHYLGDNACIFDLYLELCKANASEVPAIIGETANNCLKENGIVYLLSIRELHHAEHGGTYAPAVCITSDTAKGRICLVTEIKQDCLILMYAASA